jgi:hypothetical protein
MADSRIKPLLLVVALWTSLATPIPASPVSRPAPAGLSDEAGYIELEPVTFSFQYGSYFQRWTLRASQARMWYSFHAADTDPAAKPLFVFFNGGPGSATSFGLMSMYTSAYTLDNRIDSGGGDAFIPNPVPWTRLGNLLHIDARDAGFSYNLMDGVENGSARFREFNVQNFNPFIDGADFVRVLLRFLAAHPEIQGNRVVIVGESYGGVRSTVMLHLLLNYPDYANGREMYQDEALVGEIRRHWAAVFPEYGDGTVPPEIIARQFGRQILIQPALSMRYQREIDEGLMLEPGSVIDRLVGETGIPYNPTIHGSPLDYVENVARRDLYIYTKPVGWLNAFFFNAGRLLQNTAHLAQATGADVTAIPSLYARARTRAYRVFDENYGTAAASVLPSQGISAADDFLFLEPARREALAMAGTAGDLPAVFGALRPWDRYFIGTNGHANWAATFFNAGKVRGFEAEYSFPRYGRMFLKNLIHVRTFITHAALDLVVYGRAIPPALARHTEIVQSVRWVQEPVEEARPGRIIIEYRPAAFPDRTAPGTRTIRFPLYANSCHAVSLTQPQDLYQDVSAWLAENDNRSR